MTWLLPTLVAASIGGVNPTVDFMMPTIPVVLAQDNVPAKGGAGGSAPAAPTATAQSGDQGAAQGGGQPEGGGWQMLLIMGLIFGFFWLFFIRPQNKQMKEHKTLIENLKKGDQIVTQGGLLGRITGFEDSSNAVVVEIAQNVRIKVIRSQIARMQGSDKPAESKDKSSDKSKELKSKSAKTGTAKAGK